MRSRAIRRPAYRFGQRRRACDAEIISEIDNDRRGGYSIKLERISLEDVFIQFTGSRLRDEARTQGRFL